MIFLSQKACTRFKIYSHPAVESDVGAYMHIHVCICTYVHVYAYVYAQWNLPLSNTCSTLPGTCGHVFFFRYENAAASLLLSLANSEVQQQVYRSTSGKFSIVSRTSEELNRILVLTLARAINVICTSAHACTPSAPPDIGTGV